MARILTNYTDTECSISSSNKVVRIPPSGGQADLSDTFSAAELLSSDSLLQCLAAGENKYQLNDGNNDLTTAEAIELVRGWREPGPIVTREEVGEYDFDGKKFVRAESRPLACTTVFAGAGDSSEEIGEGKEFFWDFGTDEDLITAPSGYKRKCITFSFIDYTHIKEGTMYFHDAPKGCYADFYLIAPSGTYYYSNNDEIRFAEQCTKIDHFLIKYWMQGSVPMGDEFNTETCSAAIPSGTMFCMQITTPESDLVSNGYFQFEMYRERTVILP